MAKTKSEVTARALRDIRVLAGDEAATADMQSGAEEVLESIFAELQAEATVSWTLSTVPDSAFLALSNLLAVDLAPEYNRPPPRGRSIAWIRLMAIIRPDNRDEWRDLDDDGSVSDSEEDAGEAARFY